MNVERLHSLAASSSADWFEPRCCSALSRICLHVITVKTCFSQCHPSCGAVPRVAFCCALLGTNHLILGSDQECDLVTILSEPVVLSSSVHATNRQYGHPVLSDVTNATPN